MLDPLLTASGVSYAYSTTDALCDVSLSVGPGELLVVAGPNGSGKSTLIEVLAGVRRPRTGRVVRRGDVALVVQRPDVSPMLPVTVRDVVTMGMWRGRFAGRTTRADRVGVTEALERVGIRRLAERPLATLSGGQRQRAFLAQGLVRRPDVLLLDEPTAGIDESGVLGVHELLREETRRGAAVVCISHDPHAVAGAHRVLRLHEGRVAHRPVRESQPRSTPSSSAIGS
ncbi:zinc ABC transporter ATP-binding protein AztA [Leucobacter triazinivorans]|uniref:zinc ABC transporter ATP-binding protein AztA n=1 Tax=Leucobacter triazinivorans TaxID=1784719 RepID=UPI00197F9BAF|nr:zinc ABC transporter ATP-binding protein AztA [Leucobacter triazinivorans]